MKKLAQINIQRIKKILQNKGYKIQKNQKIFPKELIGIIGKISNVFGILII